MGARRHTFPEPERSLRKCIAIMRVKDVMRTNVRTIDPDQPASSAKELFRRYDIHHLVVVEKKNILGVVTDRDLMDRDDDTAIQRVMARPVVTISPDETVRKAAALMSGHLIGSLPVVGDGRLIGIVTSHDLLALLAKGATRPAPGGERPVLAKRGPRHMGGQGLTGPHNQLRQPPSDQRARFSSARQSRSSPERGGRRAR